MRCTGHGFLNKLSNLLERCVTKPFLKNSPLIWRLLLWTASLQNMRWAIGLVGKVSPICWSGVTKPFLKNSPLIWRLLLWTASLQNMRWAMGLVGKVSPNLLEQCVAKPFLKNLPLIWRLLLWTASLQNMRWAMGLVGKVSQICWSGVWPNPSSRTRLLYGDSCSGLLVCRTWGEPWV
jgi:hypothetical protein